MEVSGAPVWVPASVEEGSVAPVDGEPEMTVTWLGPTASGGDEEALLLDERIGGSGADFPARGKV